MGFNKQVLFLSAISAGAWLLMGWLALRPSAITEPALKDARCLDGPFALCYDFLPSEMNNKLCYVNTVFKALSYSPAGMLLADSFSRWLFTAVAIVSCESSRAGQPFLVKRGIFFLLIAQMFTAACLTPLYYAVLCWYRNDGEPRQAQIASERAWAVLLSTTGCYLLLARHVRDSNWSYDALSLWQIYPIYLAIAQTFLPVLLRPFVSRTPAAIPLFLIVLTGIALSASGHLNMLCSGMPLKEIFLPWFNGTEGLTQEAHQFFMDDYAISISALASYLVLAYGGHGIRGKVLTLLTLLLLSLLVGPGGAATAVWALRERLIKEGKGGLKASMEQPRRRRRAEPGSYTADDCNMYTTPNPLRSSTGMAKQCWNGYEYLAGQRWNAVWVHLSF